MVEIHCLVHTILPFFSLNNKTTLNVKQCIAKDNQGIAGVKFNRTKKEYFTSFNVFHLSDPDFFPWV